MPSTFTHTPGRIVEAVTRLADQDEAHMRADLNVLALSFLDLMTAFGEGNPGGVLGLLADVTEVAGARRAGHPEPDAIADRKPAGEE